MIDFLYMGKITGLTVFDVSRLFQGKGVDKKKCNEEQKGFPVIVGASSLQAGGVKVSRWIENPQSTAVFSKYGDILISAQGTCGKVGINNIGDAVITDAIIAVRSFPWLMLPHLVLMWIMYGIEKQNVIPDFDEDTVGFQRCIKADVIGNIEIQPLDTLKQIETVNAMTGIAKGFQNLETKNLDKDKEEPVIKSSKDILREIKSLQKEFIKDTKELEKMICNSVDDAVSESVNTLQGELF